MTKACPRVGIHVFDTSAPAMPPLPHVPPRQRSKDPDYTEKTENYKGNLYGPEKMRIKCRGDFRPPYIRCKD